MFKNIKRIIIGLGLLISIQFCFGQNVSRNLYIEVYEKDNYIFKMNDAFYKPDEKDSLGWKKVITIPKSTIKEKHLNFNFRFKIYNNNKVNYVKVDTIANSLEELLTKNKIIIYLGNKKGEFSDGETLINNEVAGINIQSTEQYQYGLENRADIKSEILFPNILGIKKYWSVLVLGGILFILSLSFLIYKKQIIKI